MRAFAILWIVLLLARPVAAKEELTIGISQFPNNFNPLIGSMVAKSYILGFAHRPITLFDADWKLICALCTELPSLEKGTARHETARNGKPGIAVAYTLRPDLRWGDGTPVTTRDVVFSWEVGRHPDVGASGQELFKRITHIDVKDARTFTLHVNKRTCDYDSISDFYLLPEHIERKIFEAGPKSYRDRSAYESNPANPGLWFGPYKVAKVVPGSHVVMARNPAWQGKTPAFKRILIRAIENTSALSANLLSGGIDYIAGELGLSLDQALAFEKRHGKRFRIVYRPSLIYEHIDMNLDNPALADRRGKSVV